MKFCHQGELSGTDALPSFPSCQYQLTRSSAMSPIRLKTKPIPILLFSWIALNLTDHTAAQAATVLMQWQPVLR